MCASQRIDEKGCALYFPFYISNSRVLEFFDLPSHVERLGTVHKVRTKKIREF
jgi:hypothetical protein